MALPDALTEQARLLTLNIHDSPGIDFGHVAPGMRVWPLFLDPGNGVWVLYARYGRGTKLLRHFHGGQVHFFTTKGRWNYAEHPEDEQREGSYLYESAGSVHALNVSEEDVTEGFMVAFGVNISFDEHGHYVSTEHAGSIEKAILDAAEAQGIGLPRYIKPSGSVGFTV